MLLTLVYKYHFLLQPARPVEFFQLFLGDDTTELLVEETNRSVNKVYCSTNTDKYLFIIGLVGMPLSELMV